MQPSVRYAAILLSAILVLSSLSIANYIGWLRLHPEVASVGWIADQPDYDSHVVNVYNRATERAKGGRDSFFPIYDGQDPGLFMVVAELYARAGATTPFPLQITSIVLFNLAVILFFSWVYLLFNDLMAATFATVFLVLSRFFLFFPGVTHTFPYEFFFFNTTMLLFVLFLKNNRTSYLLWALAAMFVTCMNYWFYYMSSWIIMVGLWWQYRGRPRIRDVAMISAPPIAAASLTVALVMAMSGGLSKGFDRLADLFVARTFDARIPGGTWYPDQRFMFASDWANYPQTVITRLQWAYSFDFYWFAAAAGCTFLLLWFRNRKSFVSALILLLGGFSWYYVMFQHTHIHHFVGQYSFMAICPIFGLFVSETISLIWTTLCRIKQFGFELLGPIGEHSSAASPANSMVAYQAAGVVGRIAVVALLLFVGWQMIPDYAEYTDTLIKQTVENSRTVETKYSAAIDTICREHSVITLADLQTASKDWGFEWRPQLITGSNQTPKCP
jgi:hypothetical protein